MISRIYLAALFTFMVSLVESGKHGKKHHHRPVFISKHEMACRKFAMFSYFDPELVLGPQWRIYYTWNVKKKSNCLGMQFLKISPWIVHRFWREMGEYLVKQPPWNAAVLYVTIGAAKHQMILLADYGPPGRFNGVFNLSREPSFMQYTNRKSLPLMKYQMKLFIGGKYLVIMDCLTGEITLSTRYTKDPPYKDEIELMAQQLGFGRGSLACNMMRNNSESFA